MGRPSGRDGSWLCKPRDILEPPKAGEARKLLLCSLRRGRGLVAIST